jgi:hypothetical protein
MGGQHPGGSVGPHQLQIVGPIYNVSIPYLRGGCNDDLLNICGNVYSDQTESCGDVLNVDVGTIYADGVGGSAFKLNAGQGNLIDGITTKQIGGTTAIGVFFGEDVAKASTAGGSYGNINLGHIDVTAISKALSLAGPTARSIQASVVPDLQRGRHDRRAQRQGDRCARPDPRRHPGRRQRRAVRQSACCKPPHRAQACRQQRGRGTVHFGTTAGATNIKRLEFDRIQANYTGNPSKLFLCDSNMGITIDEVVLRDSDLTFASTGSTNNAAYVDGTNTVTSISALGGGSREVPPCSA